MQNIKILLTIVIIVFLTTACNKDEKEKNPFPPNTETGANIFMFRVNGGEVINSKVGYLSSKPRISVYYSHIEPVYGSYFFNILSSRTYLEENKTIEIVVKEMPKVGKYILYGENSAFYEDLNPATFYYTNENNRGELNITKLDTINYIISGTFKFQAEQWCLSGDCSTIITVEGQFDVKYKPNNRVNYY